MNPFVSTKHEMPSKNIIIICSFFYFLIYGTVVGRPQTKSKVFKIDQNVKFNFHGFHFPNGTKGGGEEKTTIKKQQQQQQQQPQTRTLASNTYKSHRHTQRSNFLRGTTHQWLSGIIVDEIFRYILVIYLDRE